MAIGTFLGIDFSGGSAGWRARCSRPNVWVATLEASDRLRLASVVPVQQLLGNGQPFDRLVALLSNGRFVAAGIDAPFCIPVDHMPAQGYAALLSAVSALPDAPDRPFPAGASLVELAQAIAPLRSAKPLRATEGHWTKRGVNTRSTLWNGPRGGAPFAAACMTLLARSQCPIWPWSVGPGMLVESFPAAQLRAWSLPHTGYAAPDQRDVRRSILAGIRHRIDIETNHAETLLDSADALDAVLAAFGAIAATRVGIPDDAPPDGLISVMSDDLAQPSSVGPELFEALLERPDVRIERITSREHVTPIDQPYIQDQDEWVMVLEGTARLHLADRGDVALRPGEHLLIPAGVAHRVTYTADPTVWLAIHIDGQA